jgi:hypothetical protein
MVLKIVFYFVILLFIERFLEGRLDVMISLFLNLCESLGISIMFFGYFWMEENGASYGAWETTQLQRGCGIWS